MEIKGTDGVANYLRHCIFDAVAEYKAVIQYKTIHSGTIKMYKDALLRIPLQIEDARGNLVHQDGDTEVTSEDASGDA